MSRARATGYERVPAVDTVDTAASVPAVPVMAGVIGNQAMGRLLRGMASPAGGAAPPGFEDDLRLAGSGQAIPAEPRRHLEAGLGMPLDGVRLHAGDRPSALAAQVDAHAFTVGQDVYLGGGREFDSPRGYHLLAHEVAHTLQPGTGPATSSLTVGAADSPAEREAEAVATELTARRFGAGESQPPRISTGSAGANRMIRRYGKFEHRDIGNTIDETIDLGNGVVVDWGDVVSVGGDEYESENHLRNAVGTEAGRAKLREVIAKDAEHTSEYAELATRNISHFSSGGTAVYTWEHHHKGALVDAVYAGLNGDNQKWESAKLAEAFGQHFLTDTFSAGHVRTPRAEILKWYESEFAPRALKPFTERMLNRVRESFVRQVKEQMNMPDRVIDVGDFVIDKAVDAAVAGLRWLFEDFVRGWCEPMFGRGIAGAISGALHDRDNLAGVIVASEAHPDPWRAYGDGRLTCSPESFEEAKQAIRVAYQEIVDARALGRTRREMKGVVVGPGPVGKVPVTVHFGLNSASLEPAEVAALDRVADYLVANSETVLDIVGHTCPLGRDEHNDKLGQRRAESVAAYLVRRGIAANRLRSTSAGEKQLRQQDKKGYAVNRRAELEYLSSGLELSDQEWVQQIINERFPGPPYPTVARFIPHEVPGANDPQEVWRWGFLTDSMSNDVDDWIRSNVSEFMPAIESADVLAERYVTLPDISWPPIKDVTVDPKRVVREVVNELLKFPVKTLGELVGIPAGQPQYVSYPPPVTCEPSTPALP